MSQSIQSTQEPQAQSVGLIIGAVAVTLLLGAPAPTHG